MKDISLTAPLAVRARSEIVSADGTKIAAQEYGNADGAPALLLHFFGGNHLMWAPQIDSELAAKYRLITMDHRGHGESGKPIAAEAYFDGERFADDIHAVISALGLVRPVLVGWSMSGVLAGDYLAKYGDGNVGAVLLNAANNNMGNERAFQEQFGPAFGGVQGIYSPDLHEQVVAWNALNRNLTSQREDLPEGLKTVALVASMQMGEAAKQHIVMRRRGVLDHLPTYRDLRVPLLLVHGNDDAIVLPRAAEQVAAVNSQARFLRFDNVGHAPNWEGREEFNRVLGELIERRVV